MRGRGERVSRGVRRCVVWGGAGRVQERADWALNGYMQSGGGVSAARIIFANELECLSVIRRITKSCVVLILGCKSKPRMILRGLASGYLICVSPAEHLSYLIGTAEPHLQRAIRKYVAPGDTVYDIGANMGYVSLSLAKRVGLSGQVIAFEPVPQNIDLLRTNIENNQLRNVQVFEVAASDRCGEGVIRISENLSTASLIWHRNSPSAVELVVQTVAIDDLVEARDLPEPKFVKVDVEGAEGLALLLWRTI